MFDRDSLLLQRKSKKIFALFCFLFMIMILVLFLVKKDVVYKNGIIFNDNDKARILVDEENIEVIKNSKRISLLNVKYDFGIDEINKQDKMYLIDIHFSYKININCSVYQILKGKEKIINYILRITRGEE